MITTGKTWKVENTLLSLLEVGQWVETQDWEDRMTETYELTELELLEISRVGAGDDPLAKVALLKNKEETEVTDEELEKAKKRNNFV